MAVSKALQRNTGLLCWASLPSWAALSWRVITAESLGRDRKTTPKQEEEVAEATFRLEFSYQIHFRRQSTREKEFFKIYFLKISSPLWSKTPLPSCMGCQGVRISLHWQDLTSVQISGRLLRHKQELCKEQGLLYMHVSLGWTATWSPWCLIRGSAHSKTSAAEAFVPYFLSLCGCLLATALLWDLSKANEVGIKGFKWWMVQTPAVFP